MTDEAQKQAHKFATKLALAGQLRVKSVKEIYAAGYDAACTADREKMLGFGYHILRFIDADGQTLKTVEQLLSEFDAHWKGKS